MNKLFLIFGILLIGTSGVFCQDAKGMQVVEDFVIPATSIVDQHKEMVNFTLIIDSVGRGDKIYKMSWKRDMKIRGESEYLNVANDIYLKIFLVRNEEYGKKRTKPG